MRAATKGPAGLADPEKHREQSEGRGRQPGAHDVPRGRGHDRGNAPGGEGEQGRGNPVACRRAPGAECEKARALQQVHHGQAVLPAHPVGDSSPEEAARKAREADARPQRACCPCGEAGLGGEVAREKSGVDDVGEPEQEVHPSQVPYAARCEHAGDRVWLTGHGQGPPGRMPAGLHRGAASADRRGAASAGRRAVAQQDCADHRDEKRPGREEQPGRAPARMTEGCQDYRDRKACD